MLVATPQIQAFTPGSNYYGSRPLRVNKKTGLVEIVTERGMRVNSLLRRDEWRAIDVAVQQAALTRLTAVNSLKQRGLVKRLGSLGIMTTEWSQQSELTPASVNMTGQAEGERDRLEFQIAGQPVPIIYKDFNIPKRQLEAARLMGNSLDTSHATAAARVVAEMLETLLVSGSSATIFDGRTLRGFTTESNRNTGSAVGDWGTISNILPTITSMIAAAVADRYYGPYELLVSTAQYTQIATSFYTDGSGQSALQRALQIPELQSVKPCDTLADGALVLYQATEDVVDWAEHQDVSVVEWMSGDGMVAFFRVLAVATPRVKSDYNGRSGVVHFTGA